MIMSSELKKKKINFLNTPIKYVSYQAKNSKHVVSNPLSLRWS